MASSKKLGGSGPLPGLPGDWGTIREHCKHHVNTAGQSGAAHAAPSGRGLACSTTWIWRTAISCQAVRPGPGPQNQCKMLKIEFGAFHVLQIHVVEQVSPRPQEPA